jgi:hypothetical protein
VPSPPLAGFPVLLSNNFVEDNQVTTDVNGNFSGVETATQTGPAPGHPLPNNTPGTILENVQYSATGKGGWTTVASSLPANWDGMGYAFAAKIPSAAAGYWRATFNGKPGFTNATSAVRYLPAAS